MPTPITVLSILGMEHSGTTLLARILNNHPSVVAIGGIKNIGRFISGNLSCSCGKSHGRCPQWAAIEKAFSSNTNGALSDIPHALEARHSEVIRGLLASVANVYGKPVIAETSRHASILEVLPEDPGFANVAVHVFKHPGAQALSAHRGGRSVLREMRHYRRRSDAALRRLRGHAAALHISHHDFCQAPAAYLARILALAGLEPAAGQLNNWGEQELHMLGGNRMRTERSSRITSDDAWRNNLPWQHRMTVFLLGRECYRRNLAAARPYLAAPAPSR